MTILAIRTEKSEAELYLLHKEGLLVAQHHWLADRQLANQLLGTIADFLDENQASLEELSGIIVFKGPGSFTGLRIGVTVANTLAYTQQIPIVASKGKAWRQRGIDQLAKAQTGIFALPEYGALPHITTARK